MKTAKLGEGELAEISAGNPAPQNTCAFGNKGLPFVRAGSLDFLCNGGDINGLELIDKEEAARYKLRLFPKDTVVFAKSGMSAKIGRVYRLPQNAYLVSHLAAILPNPRELDSGYLSYFLQAHSPAKLIPNDAYPSIRLSEISNIEIPLPPLSEQKRIAAILDKVDGIIRKRKQSVKLLDELVKAKFVDMFGDLEINDKGWKTTTFSSIADFKNGINYTPSEAGQKIFCIGVGDFRNKVKITYMDEIEEVKLDTLPNTEYLLKDSDILIVRSNGNSKLVGRSMLTYPGKTKITFSGFCIRCRVKSELITPEFLIHILKTTSLRQKLVGRGANIKSITQVNLSSLSLILPPKSLQCAFISIYSIIDRYKNKLMNALTEAQLLKESLIQIFFS